MFKSIFKNAEKLLGKIFVLIISLQRVWQQKDWNLLNVDFRLAAVCGTKAGYTPKVVRQTGAPLGLVTPSATLTHTCSAHLHSPVCSCPSIMHLFAAAAFFFLFSCMTHCLSIVIMTCVFIKYGGSIRYA